MRMSSFAFTKPVCRVRVQIFFTFFLFSISLGCSSKSGSTQDSSTGGASASAGGSSSGGMGATAATGGEPSTGGTGASVSDETYLYIGTGIWGAAELGKILTYTIDGNTGVPTRLSEVDAGGLASFLAIDEDNGRIFAADEDNGGVLSFIIDKATGSLTRKGDVAGTRRSVYLSLAADGNHVFGAAYNPGAVEVYPVDAGGVARDPIQSENTADETHAVIARDDGQVLSVSIQPGEISSFSFSSGMLTNQSTTAHPGARHIVFDSAGRAYVISQFEDTITRYAVGSDGSLSPDFEVPRLPAGSDPETQTGSDVVVTPGGSFMYGANGGTDSTIVGYDLRESPPRLIEHEPSGGDDPRKLAMDPGGDFIAVANIGSKDLTIFRIDVDGSLQQVHNEAMTETPYFVVYAQFP